MSIFYFKYPWVYSFQGLKAIKTELRWLLVRIVLKQKVINMLTVYFTSFLSFEKKVVIVGQLL